MPSEDLMKQLDDELEAAIAAKKAQAIIATLNKIRNEQDAYDMMMNKQLKADQKRMSSDGALDNEMKAAEVSGGLRNIDDDFFEPIERLPKPEYRKRAPYYSKQKPEYTKAEMKNAAELPKLIKKGEDALMDLEED